MGQAKQRGTYEQRKTEGEERKRKEREMMAEVYRRRPSPNHTAFMAAMFGLAASGLNNR